MLLVGVGDDAVALVVVVVVVGVVVVIVSGGKGPLNQSATLLPRCRAAALLLSSRAAG